MNDRLFAVIIAPQQSQVGLKTKVVPSVRVIRFCDRICTAGANRHRAFTECISEKFLKEAHRRSLQLLGGQCLGEIKGVGQVEAGKSPQNVRSRFAALRPALMRVSLFYEAGGDKGGIAGSIKPNSFSARLLCLQSRYCRAQDHSEPPGKYHAILLRSTICFGGMLHALRSDQY